MLDDTNVHVVHRYFQELMNQGDLDVAEQITAPDFEFRITTIPLPIKGPGGLRQFATTLRSAFPDIHFEVEHLIVEGDKILARWHLHGTHRGPFLGIPPTGNDVQDHGNDVFHMRDGKLTRLWVNEDSLGLMRQLGVLPSPAAA